MEKVELNLTRKWRSKNFQEIVGQPLAVRILQNSLYLKQFFPVYLFAGQRGCGKTSTARIFAAAVNCQRLSDFQQDPRKVSIPCLVCPSCVAMSKGQHPDFIEIDAASHTGVDNVRNIIDASSFLPLMSSKKIYLIDEAHMLSKAAFNAFLKILEEPPMSVIFILATTDMHKILETVKSRCFQIFFDAVDVVTITEHLEKLCVAENIAFEQAGLVVIAKQAGGSVRDAINLLEQVRFATKKITEQAVLSILGHVGQETLLQLFEILIRQQVQELLQLSALFEKNEASIEYVWSQLTELVYDAILIKYQVEPRYFTHLSLEHKNLIIQTPLDRLTDLFALLCSQEQNLARTTKKLRYFEMMLLQHVQGQVGFQESKKKISSEDNVVTAGISVVRPDQLWQNFVKNMQACQDLVLVTMFQEAQFISFDEKSFVVSVLFLKKFMLFSDILEKEKLYWQATLQNIFGHQVMLQYSFQLIADQEKQQVNRQIIAQQNRVLQPLSGQQAQAKVVTKTLDISDITKWKLTHELLKHFDGTITEISGDMYE